MSFNDDKNNNGVPDRVDDYISYLHFTDQLPMPGKKRPTSAFDPPTTSTNGWTAGQIILFIVLLAIVPLSCALLYFSSEIIGMIVSYIVGLF